ncbi:glycoside hydrolase family 3 C-terminal domain-containing protein [Glycomyces sp. TRM65418]|uniref:beta-glucosidase n=1 Tax=Glycomyces sp. TRM65418 TaxID=2867006 RepID=UPI001CE4E62B|nr:glycoside hydrolase family 3 N-terminal domain-containing protein [Glycomyces sp. TRM65418]MCC3761554.1 glycoside hydrolase family 3 C-terminal domain-containing protein [Glycomyces sp. TRM65418]QZD55651.1 glycoside hydrolase family 3 C-terminal domain-containing protein [Glycomyces sp. TRM65418]
MDTDTPAEAAERAAGLVKRMTLEEKCAQLSSLWRGVDADAGDMAPHQSEQTGGVTEDEAVAHGLGQLTRPFGSAPVDAAEGAANLASLQRRIRSSSRFGIAALAHEECLTGFMARGATIFPTALAWGATFDPELVGAMARQIGASMRAVGVHQGLAPVLDVVADSRWGRTEETMGEDPYLTGILGTAYVAGLQDAGIIATLKHFAGYSASHAARNFGPVFMGDRQFAETYLTPFEMAVRIGRAGSVMPSYAANDGVPAHANPRLLTGILRDEWGFEGTIVSDYFGVNFLNSLHGVAADRSHAAVLALGSGLDVELPSVDCYGAPLRDAVAAGQIEEDAVDRAVERVLTQKISLGLLEEVAEADGPIDLDPPEARALAAQVARRSIVLLSNDGTLPLRGEPGRIALVGPVADDKAVMLGCYAFPNHHGRNDADELDPDDPYPHVDMGVAIDTLARSLAASLPGAAVEHVAGGTVLDAADEEIAAAANAAAAADLAVVAVGDRSGLFGRGTSGEGCDAPSHALPGRQAELLEAVLDSGTPTVVVVISGRPYALGTAPDRAAAIVQAFLPGQEGAGAISAVLTGAAEPAGRLPAGVPARPDSPPATYLGPELARRSSVSTVDPTPRYVFGHGLSYTEFAWDAPRLLSGPEVGPEGAVETAVRVRNAGDRHGSEVVQLYLHDPVASVVRPVQRLVGFARLDLGPGEAREVRFAMPVELAAFVGGDGGWVVEAGRLELRLARSAADVAGAVEVEVTGTRRLEPGTRALETQVTVESVLG